MSKSEISKPTEAELQILQVLWKKGKATVREVHQELANQEDKEVGYTTTLKIMQNMVEKNLVDRDTEGKTHIYEALVKENDTQKHLLDRFLHTAFGGSAKKLVMQVLGNETTSKEELDEIKKMIDKFEQEGGAK